MVVGVRLLTGVLDPQMYGELALGMTAAMLVQLVIIGPVGNSALRFFAPAREAGDLFSFLAALRTLVIRAVILILILVFLSCVSLLIMGRPDWILLGGTAFGYALISGISFILDSLQNAARQRPVVAWHHALSSWGRFLCAVGLVVWLGGTSSMAMLGYGLASILTLASQGWFFKQKILSIGDSGSRQPIKAVRKNWQNKMFSYSWPFAFWGFFSWAQMASGRWALQIFSSTQEVGYFAVLYQLGFYPITIATAIMMRLVSPVFFHHAGDASDPSRIYRVYKHNLRMVFGALMLTIAATVGSIFVHAFIFRLFVAPKFQFVSWLLPIVVLSGGLFAVGQFSSISLLSSNESRSLLAPKTGSSILGLILNFAGAYWWGIPGVVWANLVFSTLFMSWIFVLVLKRRNQLSLSEFPAPSAHEDII